MWGCGWREEDGTGDSGSEAGGGLVEGGDEEWVGRGEIEGGY